MILEIPKSSRESGSQQGVCCWANTPATSSGTECVLPAWRGRERGCKSTRSWAEKQKCCLADRQSAPSRNGLLEKAGFPNGPRTTHQVRIPPVNSSLKRSPPFPELPIRTYAWAIQKRAEIHLTAQMNKLRRRFSFRQAAARFHQRSRRQRPPGPSRGNFSQ